MWLHAIQHRQTIIEVYGIQKIAPQVKDLVRVNAMHYGRAAQVYSTMAQHSSVVVLHCWRG